MSEPDPSGASDGTQAMILGEMRGQLREVVHSMNNLSSKFDGLTREVVGLGVLAADILDIKARVKVLEDTKNRHDGASGVIGAIMRSPTLGWLVGAAITAWAILTGKVNV
jgi:hypothetical protein